MTNSAQVPKPTAKQLRYLRHLANSRGQTFTTPTTRAEASTEIERLREVRAESRAERATESFILSQGVVDRWAPATAVREDEIEGYGSSARWK